MGRSVNKVILVGNLGRDAELSYTQSQTALVKFSIATTHRWKDNASGEWKEETQWTNCVMWRGDKVAPFLTKGKTIYAEGRLQTRSYEKDGKKVYTTEVVIDEVILLGGGSDRPAPQQQEAWTGEDPAF